MRPLITFVLGLTAALAVATNTGSPAAPFATAAAPTGPAVTPDPRHIANGWPIASEGYADQPYLVKTDDGAWLCAVTTGKGVEGATG
jgi:hypothetical protein